MPRVTGTDRWGRTLGVSQHSQQNSVNRCSVDIPADKRSNAAAEYPGAGRSGGDIDTIPLDL